MHDQAEYTVRRNRPLEGFRHWRSLSDGFLACLVVVGPTFLFAELWRGRPLVDRGFTLWFPPAVVMALGFFFGGRVAGRHRRAPRGAIAQGLVVASLVLALIFIADVIRRLVLGQTLDSEVIALWAGAGAAALVVAAIGGLFGRWRTLQAIKRRELRRFR